MNYECGEWRRVRACMDGMSSPQAIASASRSNLKLHSPRWQVTMSTSYGGTRTLCYGGETPGRAGRARADPTYLWGRSGAACGARLAAATLSW